MTNQPLSAGPDVDVAIVGAGVVGLAVAAVLSESRSVAIIERHESYGRETSSHNSGVVHAGIYHPPDWLKTTLCVEGNCLLYSWAEEHGVRARRTGKLIVATEDAQLPALQSLAEAAMANGVADIRLLDANEVHRLEPAIRAVAAVYSGSSGVVDQMGLMRSFLDVGSTNGAHIAFNHTLVAAERADGGFKLHIQSTGGSQTELSAACLVNCGGLFAQQIGESLGYDPDGGPGTPAFRQTINKGRYYDLVNPQKARRYSHLVYPLPHTDRAGLGVHLTLDIDGAVHLGPDTEWLKDGAPLDCRAADDRRDAFVESVRPYLPDIDPDDLAVGQVGYRPKLNRPSEPPRDFLIWHDRGYIHLGGVESPGLTASLAIARHVAGLIP